MLLHVVGSAEVGRDRQSFRCSSVRQLRGEPIEGVELAADQRHFCAVAPEALRDRRADSTAGAGDDCALSVEPQVLVDVCHDRRL